MLKLGQIAEKKTKSVAKKAALLVCSFFLSACGQVVVYPSELTATAWALQGTPLPVSTENPSGSGLSDLEFVTPIVPSPQSTPDVFNTLESAPVAIDTPNSPLTVSTHITPSNGKPPFIYYALTGDTLPALSNRFGVDTSQISSSESIPLTGLINPGQLLIIPNNIQEFGPEDAIFPDSEVVYSPSSIGFDTEKYVMDAGGTLSKYREYLGGKWMNGGEVIQKYAQEYSINPRLILALLEYQSNWVFGAPQNIAQSDYPMGWKDYSQRGLLKQLGWAVKTINIGYYQWREGKLDTLIFSDNSDLRIAPSLNAGSVALQYFFSKTIAQRDWNNALYSTESVTALYEDMFGSPWLRAQEVEPLYPPDFTQPNFSLPYPVGNTWNFTGGPHAPWGEVGSLAALDFAPHTDHTGCDPSEEFVTAISTGYVLRDGNGYIIVDLDGDGHEQTGWVILYLHLANDGKVQAGQWINAGDPLGRASCEGGLSTGTHVHLARKYNGEWIAAAGPVPFNLSGWVAAEGLKPYLGTMTNGDLVSTASVVGSHESNITRLE